MAKEFQPYFYLSKQDLHTPKPGKMVGLILVSIAFILIILRILNIVHYDFILLLVLLGFGILSLAIGKIIHTQDQEEKKEEDFKEPPPTFDNVG